MNKYGQSFFSSLFNFIPEFQVSKDYVEPSAAKLLYNIWRTGTKTSHGTYRRPSTFSMEDVKTMQKEGLVKTIGGEVEITEKGAKVIKVMVLGDDKSIFEDDGKILDYNKALSNTKNVKTAGNTKVAGWWDRFDKK
jgi:hypothetical protein